MDKIYNIQWEAYPLEFCKNMCSLLEDQMLVDLTIMSSTYAFKIHKIVLAAGSAYFRDRLKQDFTIDRIVLTGVKYKVIQAIVQFLYCGEAVVEGEDMKEFILTADYFQIKNIKSIQPEKISIDFSEFKDSLFIMKPPLFISKNEKSKTGKEDFIYAEKNVNIVLEEPSFSYESAKRKRSDIKISPATNAALVKEEEASRLALELLQKDFNNVPKMYMVNNQGNFNNEMPVQSVVINNRTQNMKPILGVIPVTEATDYRTDLPILYKTNDGSLVNVTNDVLQTLTENGPVQYQVMAEQVPVGNLNFYDDKPYGYTQVVPGANFQNIQNASIGSDTQITYDDFLVSDSSDNRNVEIVTEDVELSDVDDMMKQNRRPSKDMSFSYAGMKDANEEITVDDFPETQFQNDHIQVSAKRNQYF